MNLKLQYNFEIRSAVVQPSIFDVNLQIFGQLKLFRCYNCYFQA